LLGFGASSVVRRPVSSENLYSWWFSTDSSVCSHLLTLVPRSRIFYPEDGGDTFLRNVGSLENYTAPHPKKPAFFIVTAVKTSDLTQKTQRLGPTVLGPLERANFNHWTLTLSKGQVSPPSPEDGNRSSFRNVVFSNLLEYRTMDINPKPNNSGNNTTVSLSCTRALSTNNRPAWEGRLFKRYF
jgi:hypothetical protein